MQTWTGKYSFNNNGKLDERSSSTPSPFQRFNHLRKYHTCVMLHSQAAAHPAYPKIYSTPIFLLL